MLRSMNLLEDAQVSFGHEQGVFILPLHRNVRLRDARQRSKQSFQRAQERYTVKGVKVADALHEFEEDHNVYREQHHPGRSHQVGPIAAHDTAS